MILAILIKALAYKQQVAKKFAYFSAITHCPINEVETWTCKKCQAYKLTNVKYINNEQTHIAGFVGYSPQDNTIMVIFRGTDDTKNWISDFTFDKVVYSSCRNCQVHNGFYLDYLSVHKQVLSAVQFLLQRFTGAKVMTGGHSLGASLATLAALQIQSKYKNVEGMINFGSPRVGNDNLAAFVNTQIKEIFRLTHFKDLVPHLPPQAFGFKHVYHQVFYSEDFKTFKVCDESGEDKSCADQFNQFSTSDHDFYFINQSC